MTEQNILNGNKLIAEFMGLDVLYGTHVHHKTADKGKVTIMKYHSSWDWLMDVVESIENLPLMNISNEKLPQGFEVIMRGNTCTIDYGNGAEGMVHDFLNLWDGSFSGNKHEATYKAVIEFIKWYNENKNK